MIKQALLLAWGVEIALIAGTVISLPHIYAVTDLAITADAETISLTPRYKKQTLFPDKRLVALYGSPNFPALGALGEQNLKQTIQRAKDVAKKHQAHTSEKVMPALEIIASVASRYPTDNGDYSAEQPLGLLEHWVQKAEAAGVYVILDLQPGRADFLTQAKIYKPLLAYPHVGLALDPEWRLQPHQFHLRQIGSVNIDEVNQVANWLADLTKARNLPQKLFLLHEFKLTMLPDRERLDTSRLELAYLIQMDGQGPQGSKLETWAAVRRDPPAGVYFGWKNFYDEDSPTRSPADTMALSPSPWYVSYQ